MTNTELITFNEFKNDGSTIHLYYDKGSGLWISYGLSAYSLKQICAEFKIQSIESYSTDLQMPCVSTRDIEIVYINSRIIDASDDYYMLDSYKLVAIDKTYTAWAKSLRNL